MSLRRPARALTGLCLVLATSAACGAHDDNTMCTSAQRAQPATTVRFAFADQQERPVTPSAPATPESAVTLRVGERLDVTVGYPRDDHPSVPAASGTPLCEVSHAEHATGTDAMFLAVSPGDAGVSATIDPGARAFRPDLTLAVHVS